MSTKILNQGKDMTDAQPENLIWLDLEMTGLNPDHDRIIEIATVVTNMKLETIAEGPVFAIHQSNDMLDNMDSWNKQHHGKSGLIARVQKSKVTEGEAEDKTLDFLVKHVKFRQSPLCGNSICQDRRFLWKYMPKLEEFFHYRNLDVSTIKILAQAWAPEIAHKLKKKSEHVALQDIRDSIDELKYYREYLFK